MQWKGKKYKAGLREGHTKPVERAHTCARRREYCIISFKLNDIRNRDWRIGVGRISPTFVVSWPIKCVYLYDVIRGGH